MLSLLPVRAASDAPLRLSIEYDQSSGQALMRVETTGSVTLSNYDFDLTWDKDAFSLAGIDNGQPGLLPYFAANRESGHVSCMSGTGRNTALASGAVVAVYRLSASEETAAGSYDVSLTVANAATEGGDSLAWKGERIDGSIRYEPPTVSVPLRVVTTYDVQQRRATVSVVAAEALTLSNFDFRLDWDSGAFALEEITNAQSEKLGYFAANPAQGMVSAMSGNGQDVSIAAEEALLTFTLTASAAAETGDYPVSVTVANAATEDGDALAWKGERIDGSIRYEPPTVSVPLRVETTYDAQQRRATVSVVATEALALSNYDLRLDWDGEAFALEEITNAQSAKLGYFVANPAQGMASAMSGNGQDVSIAAEETLLTFTLTASAAAEAGNYPVSVTVANAATEDGDALAWKGAILDGTVTATQAENVPHGEIGAITVSGGRASATIHTSKTATVYFAVYNEYGMLLAVQSRTLTADETAELTFPVANGAKTVKLFLIDATGAPLCAAQSKNL
jgi:hypothetical protein